MAGSDGTDKNSLGEGSSMSRSARGEPDLFSQKVESEIAATVS